MRGKLEEIRDVAEGLWLWRVRHPKWHHGPYLFWRDDIPETDLEPIDPGTRLPGGLLALRSMLKFPFEHVIISHGQPLHDRTAFERALELPAWPPDAG